MMQLAFDLHRLLGLLSAIALLVLAFTGILLSYPSVLEILAGSSVSNGVENFPVKSVEKFPVKL